MASSYTAPAKHSAECTTGELTEHTYSREEFEQKLNHLKALHHSQCLFNSQTPVVPGLQFRFDDSGILHGEFTCNGYHQGYDNMVHGGVIAAIIDASMAQCLMGHGVVAYTAKLSIRYRKPVLIRKQAVIKTSIENVDAGLLYTIKTTIMQDQKLVVQGTGRFFMVEKE